MQKVITRDERMNYRKVDTMYTGKKNKKEAKGELSLQVIMGLVSSEIWSFEIEKLQTKSWTKGFDRITPA